jgi:hypothetical protein
MRGRQRRWIHDHNEKTADLVGLKSFPKVAERSIPEIDGSKKSGVYRVPLTLPIIHRICWRKR